MSTPEERAKNRAKQRRFYERHKHEHQPKNVYPFKERGKKSNCRTYELADPRDGIIRVIGWNRVTIRPIWANLWDAKEYSLSKWAIWLRELASLGLKPVDLTKNALGIFQPLPPGLAHTLTISRLAELPTLRTLNGFRHPVGCENKHFSSIYQAAKITGINYATLRGLVYVCGRDSQGRQWFDD